MVLKNGQRALEVLSRWWHSVDDYSVAPTGIGLVKNTKRGKLGEPLTVYRTAWAHEQRVMDDYLAVEFPTDVRITPRIVDYNTWGGNYAQHYFWKEAHVKSYFGVALDSWGNPLVLNTDGSEKGSTCASVKLKAVPPSNAPTPQPTVSMPPTPQTVVEGDFTVVLMTNRNTASLARVAICTWVQEVKPGHVMVAADFERSHLEGGCVHKSTVRKLGFLVVPLPSNYYDTLQRLWAAHKNAKITLKSFVIFLQPFTLLRPGRLASFLRDAQVSPFMPCIQPLLLPGCCLKRPRFSCHTQARDPAFMSSSSYAAGALGDAVSELSSMGMLPRPAHE